MTDKKTGRILRSLSGFYDVQTDGGVISCRGRGHLRRGADIPLTGDMVEISVERGKGMVEKILPRKNHFVRPAVANVDVLVIFAANVNPITEPFLIDRVAAIAGDQEVPVVLVVNKCDLDPAVDLVRIYQNAGFTVIQTSAETGMGVEQLQELLLQNVVAYDGTEQLTQESIIMDYSEIMNKGYGKCHVKYRAEDSEGNRSEVVVLTIDVDMEAPKIRLRNEQQGEIRVSNMQRDKYLMDLVEVTDNSGKVDLTVSRPLTYTPGEPYIVMYCARDDYGNVSTLSVTYHVKE
jgi:GTPase SAR1 family protein